MHSNAAFPYGMVGLNKPFKTMRRAIESSNAVAPEGQSHIDPGHASLYTQGEEKYLWTGR